ncbi:spore cortex biosynthesis protein YabQ [Alicyclobacillus ferrooxydans]|uniref:spore cortex biosynthesis protein YabQ n=1 Tax=Alicyclobacillus ferrooxydans TaxID=471514 RepID=UPI0006D55E6F|nr:spore cortex biosynthesis protein YabQ [Alicyclobacillus ferrooxydans]
MTAQGMYILVLVTVGALMGIVFDVYNTVTGAAKWFRWLRPVLDIAFWVVSAATVYYTALQMDSGRLRIYTFLLILAGYLLYRMLLHATVVASAFRIVRFTQRVVRAFARVLEVLLWRPLRFILRLLAALAQGLYKIGCKLESSLFFLLRVIVIRVIWPWLSRIPGIRTSFEWLSKVWKEFWDRASNWVQARVIRS